MKCADSIIPIDGGNAPVDPATVSIITIKRALNIIHRHAK
jgi:hypothetical protein